MALGRKNHLFAGSDGGGVRWATICSLIATAKLNNVEPFYLAQRRPAAHDRRSSRQPPRRTLAVELAANKPQSLTHGARNGRLQFQGKVVSVHFLHACFLAVRTRSVLADKFSGGGEMASVRERYGERRRRFKSGDLAPFRANDLANPFLLRVGARFVTRCHHFRMVRLSAVRSGVHPGAGAQGH
jgi:hypothetical protein